jgi:hypothetical protein
MSRKRHAKQGEPSKPSVGVASPSPVVAELRAIELRFAPGGETRTDRLRAQLDAWRLREADEHLEFQIPESFGRVLFTKLCERYGLEAHRDGSDPLMLTVEMPPGFAEEVLWPQYDAMGAVIARYVHGHVSNVLAAWLNRPA